MTLKTSPLLAPLGHHVGATTIDDTFASSSNFGNKIDILAPGQDIFSADFQTSGGAVTAWLLEPTTVSWSA